MWRRKKKHKERKEESNQLLKAAKIVTAEAACFQMEGKGSSGVPEGQEKGVLTKGEQIRGGYKESGICRISQSPLGGGKKKGGGGLPATPSAMAAGQ